MNRSADFSAGLLETQQVASILLDQAGTILQFNEIASLLTGLAVESAVGMQLEECFEILLADGKPASLADLADKQASGLHASLISRHQSLGAKVEVSLSLMLITGPAGEEPRVLLNAVPRLPSDTLKNHLAARALLSLDWQEAPLAVICWNTCLEAEQWNPGAEQIFGYSAEQAIGKHANELIIPDHRFSGVTAEFADLLGQISGTFGVYENITADGQQVFCEWYNTPLVDEHGVAIGVVTLAQDVTERLQTQQRLQQSEQRFRDYFEQSLTGISIIDPELGWVDVNQQLCRMLGYSREELLSAGWKNVLSDKERLADLEISKKILTGELDQISFESKRICKDGSIIHVEVNTNVVRTTDGEVDYFVSQLLDITERTRQRRDLDQTLSLLVGISDALPDLVYFKDRNGVYQRVNKAFEKAAARSNDQIAGLTDADLFPTEVAQQFRQQDFSVINNPDPDAIFEIEERQVGTGPDYNTRKLQVRDSNGFVMGVLGISRDITELNQTRQALRYSQTILDLTSDMMALYDRNGNHLSANRAYCEAYKVPFKDLVGMHVSEVLGQSPEALIYILENHRRCLAGEVITTKAALDFPGLGLRHVVAQDSPYRDESGDIVGLVVTIHDITDLEEASEGLRRYEQILSATHDLMSFVTPDYKLAAVNDAFVKFFDFDRKDVLGTKSLVQAVDREDLSDLFKSRYERCLAGEVLEFEQAIGSPVTGEEHFFEVIYYPFQDANGVITGLVSSARDITARRKTEEDLRSYKDIVSASQDYMAMLDLQYRFVALNKQYESYFGRPAGEILGKTVLDIYGDSERFEKVFIPAYNRALSGEVVCYEQKVYQPGSGDEGWAEFRYYPSYNEAGEIIGLVVNVRDITDRKQAELKLKQLSQAVELSPSAVMICDSEGLIEYVNPAFERTSGHMLREIEGKTPFEIEIYNRADAKFPSVINKITTGLTWSGETQSRKKTGEAYWENVFFSPIHNDEGEISHYLAVKEDISLRRQQEEQLARQAYYDPLTELPNRMLAFERLRQAMARADRNDHMVAVIFIDLDHFKAINDTLGHGYGDQLLKAAGKRLKNCIRSEDTVARLGGDEFLVLLTDVTRIERTQPIIDKIIDCFNRSFEVGSNELYVTASLGVAVYPNDSKEVSDLLRNADTAMYHAKDKGRNRFNFFTEEMDAEAHQRLNIEFELRNALERNELYLEYQPIVDGYSGHVVGFEALARWKNERFGSVPPDKFIPIAEETGLIHEIGSWVIDTACTTLQQFRAQGYERLRVAVNVSSKQFQDFGFVDSIKAALLKTAVPAYSLTLEVTENLLLEERNEVAQMLYQLTQLGVRLSVDDFGTGYSSLSYLKKYPFNALKIDRSFVKNIVDDADDLNLTKAIIAMAHALHLEVIAEGVEDQVQLALLRAESCDFVQGYLISRPIPADELLAFIKQRDQ
ncbi:MAG: PAS domain S-box protein [Pseudomonadales bacterium]|nr:PAS domain S-box protein [Pseudomonadales bacterium]